VQLPDQPKGQWEVTQPFDAVLESAHVVSDLTNIVGIARRPGIRFVHQEFRQVGGGSLDSRRENRFSPDVRGDEEMAIGKKTTEARELGESGVSLRQCADEFVRPFNVRWQRAGNERVVAACGSNNPAIFGSAEVFWIQGVSVRL
jgi:hypothetical protein